MIKLRCVVERITYLNPDNGYTVLKVKVSGYKDPVTLIGYLLDLPAGTVLLCEGEWKVDQKYGNEFVADTWTEIMPSTLYGIERYLSSGLVKGIGPKYAKLIVKQFGLQTLEVIENNIQCLFTNVDVEGNFTNQGDGIQLGMWAGAQVQQSHAPMIHHMGGGADLAGVGVMGNAGFLNLDLNGKRFMNEGAIAQMQATCLRQPAGLACYVTDANWAKTLKAAPLDHGAPNFGMQDYWDKIEQDMNNTVSGQANTITIANLAERTQMAGTIYRADTLEELADLLGYKGAAKQNFLDSIAHYNELCYAGVDSDYGKDAPYMVPIDTAPFFGGTSSTGHSSNPMMVTMSGVITDETQNVLNKDWEPIEGLYVAGNCLGGRYGFGYSTPFAGNSVGMAMTHGWTAGHQVASDKKFLGEPVEAMEAPAGGPGGPH